MNCPNCGNKLPSIKSKFKCSECNVELKSDITFITIVSLVLGGTVGQLVGARFCESQGCIYIVDVLFAATFYWVAYKNFLNVCISEEKSETDAGD